MAQLERLWVQMLGGFSLQLNGKTLDPDLGNTKRQQLLQLLLYSGKPGITREQLIENLYGDDDTGDVSNSLKALMFRLRRQLQEVLPDGANCIRYYGGAYHWAGLPCRVDVHVFEQAAKAALQADDADCLSDAALLFTGEFLPDLTASAWVAVVNTRLTALFGRCMNRAGELLRQAGSQERALALYSHACRLQPAEEEWQLGRADALTALGRGEEALACYNEYVRFLFDNLGVQPDAELLERLQKISEQLRQPSANFDTIYRNLNDQDPAGAFYCAYPHFQDSYRIFSRVIARSGQSAFLVMAAITDVHGEELQEGPRLEDAMARLHELIGNTLRSSDTYTRYSASQFLMLLLGLHQEDCDTVTERVEARFGEAKESWGFRLRFRAMPVKAEDALARFMQGEK